MPKKKQTKKRRVKQLPMVPRKERRTGRGGPDEGVRLHMPRGR